MFGLHPAFWLRCSIVVLVVAVVALGAKGWSWVERCLLAVAILSSLLAIQSFLTATDTATALVAAGVSFGLLALARGGRAGIRS